MDFYKHFVTISSQLYFCSSPIRLDSYNRCQYGCVYCFARNRGKEIVNNDTKCANVIAFSKRLERVKNNNINSALDEFLKTRVPIQLGGLYEPFSSIEEKYGITYRLLSVLQEFNYPTLISTKGNIFSLEKYINLLNKMNVYLRISAAGVSEKIREKVDVGCDTFQEVLEKIRFLSDAKIPISLRIQPVIPGFEESALDMAEKAAGAGVNHVAFEYLKLASEDKLNDIKNISHAINFNIWNKMNQLGIKRIGRDYTLRAKAKKDFLFKAKKLCDKFNIKFGAGDTEFIHLSDGDGCCNSSSFFLNDATQFRSNFVGVLSNRKIGDNIFFKDLAKEWNPLSNVHQYLTTNSRSRDMSGSYPSWMSLLAYRWNGGHGPYSPDFFYGIDWTGDTDNDGFKIYTMTKNLS